jgi:hypothetical protein
MVVGLADVIAEPARTAKLLAVPRSTSIGVALRGRKTAATTTRPWEIRFAVFRAGLNGSASVAFIIWISFLVVGRFYASKRASAMG